MASPHLSVSLNFLVPLAVHDTISHLCIDQGETVVAARIGVRWRKTRKEEVDRRGLVVVLAVVA